MNTRIKEIRKRENLSQSEFARRIDATPGFISNVETGRSGLSDEKIRVFCNCFGVDETWLRTGEGAPPDFTSVESIEGVGTRIKLIRKRMNLSQDEFARMIGVHKNRIYAVETGKSKPTKNMINKVVRSTQIDYNWLLTGEGSPDKVDLVDDELIEWLRQNQDVAKEIRERAGL